MSMGHHGIPSGGSRNPLPLRLPSPHMGARLLHRGRVGYHSSVPGKHPGALWGVGQQTNIGMDASLSLPPAEVFFLLPH